MKHIDTARFCKVGTSLAGSLTQMDLPRLAAEVLPDTGFTVAWIATGVSPDLLDLSLRATVQMRCQRCLDAMAESIDVSYRFQFVKDEATAQAQDEASDEVDTLVHARHFDLGELIEDEMLMALPFVSLHEVCPEAGALSFVPRADKPNPFAVLKDLKS
ncbi:MAG: YceD family protein [Cytophagales bacterium]|nr:YceD family protein [Cytophagales bacterium]